MYPKLLQFLSRFENKRLENANYFLLLAIFNCSLIMNFQEMMWKIPIAIIMLSLTLISALNYRLWWASMANIAIGLLLLMMRFPRIPNHCNLEVFACISTLGIFALKILRPNLKMPPQLASQLFRVCLVTVYFYTGFHKLNTDFFNPCVSCVNWANANVLENFIGYECSFSNNVILSFQIATLFVEMILPFGLLWHQSRKITAILLLGFHFYLAFNMFAAFSAFVSFMILGCLLDFRQKEIHPKIISALQRYIIIVLITFFIKLVLTKIKFDAGMMRFIIGITYNIGYLIFFAAFFRYYKQQKQTETLRHFPIVALAFLCISFWSMKTYIGLGNTANLTMFTNLMTEKSRSNHLLIDTKKTKFFDFEEDNVLILALHDTLKNENFVNYKLPMVEFQYISDQWSQHYKNKINCTLVYQNDTIVVPDLKKSPFPKPKWWYKYLYFRKIKPEGPMPCYW